MQRASLRYAIPAALLVVLLTGGGFAALETDTVSSYWKGVWWALALMTTVGFAGDTPDTVAGQVLSGLLMILGFILLALVTAAVASFFVREEEEPDTARERAFQTEALAELRALHDRLNDLERASTSDPTLNHPEGGQTPTCIAAANRGQTP